MVLFELDSTHRRVQIDPYSLPCANLKYTHIKELNLKSATLNLIEEKMENIEYINTVEDHEQNTDRTVTKINN